MQLQAKEFHTLLGLLETRREARRHSSPGPLKIVEPCWHLRTSCLQNCKRIHFVVLSCPAVVCYGSPRELIQPLSTLPLHSSPVTWGVARAQGGRSRQEEAKGSQETQNFHLTGGLDSSEVDGEPCSQKEIHLWFHLGSKHSTKQNACSWERLSDAPGLSVVSCTLGDPEPS